MGLEKTAEVLKLLHSINVVGKARASVAPAMHYYGGNYPYGLQMAVREAFALAGQEGLVLQESDIQALAERFITEGALKRWELNPALKERWMDLAEDLYWQMTLVAPEVSLEEQMMDVEIRALAEGSPAFEEKRLDVLRPYWNKVPRLQAGRAVEDNLYRWIGQVVSDKGKTYMQLFEPGAFNQYILAQIEMVAFELYPTGIEIRKNLSAVRRVANERLAVRFGPLLLKNAPLIPERLGRDLPRMKNPVNLLNIYIDYWASGLPTV